MELIRLDKLLSQTLLLSRSDAKKKLRDSQVLLNGKVCKSADEKVNPAEDEIVVSGVRVVYQKYIYIMLHKPAGVVSASKDPNEKTVVDLVPAEIRRKGLFPAGRLDKDTTGFVLITDDGDFAHRILAPGKHVPKTYHVTLTRPVSAAEIAELADGPVLDDEKLLPVRVTLLDDANNVYRVILMEGRYHQIKRMFAKQGNPVVALHRTQMGKLPLDDSLQPGECKVLSAYDLALITSKE